MAYSYDQKYRKSKTAFGSKPEKILVQFHKEINNSSPVLDVGAGQGRHAFYLAKNGFAVEALEPSEVGISQMKVTADKEQLPIHFSHGDLASFEPKTNAYSAILLFGILQILTRKQISELVESIKEWTAEDSLIFITAFSTEEPSYEKHKRDDEEIGKNSFKDSKDFIRTYLEKNEIVELFCGYEVLHHHEYLREPHHHGDGNMHQHAVIEAVLRVG